MITRRDGLTLAFGAAMTATSLATCAQASGPAPEPRSAPGAVLGEGPLWDDRDGRLYWVDIRGQKLHSLSLTGEVLPNADSFGVATWDMPDLVNWIVLRESGGFLVALRRTVYALTLAPFSLTPLFSIEADKTDNRLNDAKVDAKGRLWTGTMHMPWARKDCGFYRVDADHTVTLVDSPYQCTNGPTFSLDGRTLWHNETFDRTILAFDVAEDGSLSNKRVFIAFTGDMGSPDGLMTDAQGGVWVAHYGAGRLSRYLTDGTLDFSIDIPAKQSTSLTFAGANLDRLFVTTAAQPPVGEDDPMAGTLFEVPAALLRGHTGLKANRYKG